MHPNPPSTHHTEIARNPHRLAWHSLWWTIAGVVSAVVIGVIGIYLQQSLADAPASGGSPGDAGSAGTTPGSSGTVATRLYGGDLALEAYGEDHDGDGDLECYYSGLDFDFSPDAMGIVHAFDDNEFDKEIDLQYVVCPGGDPEKETYGHVWGTVKIRSQNASAAVPSTMVSDAASCEKAVVTPPPGADKRQWTIIDTARGWTRPDPDAFCLLTPTRVVRIVFKDFQVDSEPWAILIDVTAWPRG